MGTRPSYHGYLLLPQTHHFDQRVSCHLAPLHLLLHQYLIHHARCQYDHRPLHSRGLTLDSLIGSEVPSISGTPYELKICCYSSS